MNALLIVGYARSGVTMLNRILSNDERLICLSEINSRFRCPTHPNTPREQVAAWYNIQISKKGVLEEIGEIFAICQALGKFLVIRDWSFGSYVPLPYNNYRPTGTLQTLDDLTLVLGSHLKTVALVRNPFEIWASMLHSAKAHRDIQLKHLHAFVLEVIERGILALRYEDLCDTPEDTLEAIYRKIGLARPSVIGLSHRAVGDISFPQYSRGAHLPQPIRLPPRHLGPSEMRLLMRETAALEIAELLGYSPA